MRFCQGRNIMFDFKTKKFTRTYEVIQDLKLTLLYI